MSTLWAELAMGTTTLLECFACSRRVRWLPRPLRLVRPFQPIRCYPETAPPHCQCTYGDRPGSFPLMGGHYFFLVFCKVYKSVYCIKKMRLFFIFIATFFKFMLFHLQEGLIEDIFQFNVHIFLRSQFNACCRWFLFCIPATLTNSFPPRLLVALLFSLHPAMMTPPLHLTYCCCALFLYSPSHQWSLQIRAHCKGLGHGLRQCLSNEQWAGVQLICRQWRRWGC